MKYVEDAVSASADGPSWAQQRDRGARRRTRECRSSPGSQPGGPRLLAPRCGSPRRVSRSPHRGGCFPQRVPESKALLEIGAVQPRRHIVDGAGPRGGGPFDHALRVLPRVSTSPSSLVTGTSRVERPSTSPHRWSRRTRAAEVNRRIGSLPRGLCSATLAVHRARRGPSGRRRGRMTAAHLDGPRGASSGSVSARDAISVAASTSSQAGASPQGRGSSVGSRSMSRFTENWKKDMSLGSTAACAMACAAGPVGVVHRREVLG